MLCPFACRQPAIQAHKDRGSRQCQTKNPNPISPKTLKPYLKKTLKPETRRQKEPVGSAQRGAQDLEMREVHKRLLAGCLQHIKTDACEGRQTRPTEERHACMLLLHSHAMNRDRPERCCTVPLKAGGLPSKPPKIGGHDTAKLSLQQKSSGGSAYHGELRLRAKDHRIHDAKPG